MPDALASQSTSTSGTQTLTLPYVPIYGKFAGFGDFIFHYDVFVVGGGGAISTRPIASINPQDRTFAWKVKPNGHLGVGLRIFFSRWLAAVAEISDYIYEEDLENTNARARGCPKRQPGGAPVRSEQLDQQRSGAGGSEHFSAVHVGVPAAQVTSRHEGFEAIYRCTGTCKMRGFVKTVSAFVAAAAAMVSLTTAANAQEIQLTGPLAGAPAVRKLRLHRQGRLEISPGVMFTLLDQYMHTAMPGGTLTYHINDWLGFGVWGAFGTSYPTNLGDNLQTIVNQRGCSTHQSTAQCQLTNVNLGRAPYNNLANNQFGHMDWVVAPQAIFIPFRGKMSFFATWFVDADLAIFGGPAIVGMKERTFCGTGEAIAICSDADAFKLVGRTLVAPTFGLSLNFYPLGWLGIGFDFRALPFAWNTGGFDNHGGGPNNAYPDNTINGADQEFHFNTLAGVNLKFALPYRIKSTD